MTQPVLWTYNDVVSQLLDYVNATSDTVAIRKAKRAVLSAYRTVTAAKNWAHYYVTRQITTTAQYNTGTIVYDHTGGTNEREVTLSSGTWPTDAASGSITIAGYNYEVDTYVSSTVITLKVNSNPGADVAAGTSYVWFRDTYRLPINFRALGEFTDIYNNWVPEYVTPGEWLLLHRGVNNPSTPRCFTITRDPNDLAVLAIRLWPPPLAAYTFDMVIQTIPLPLLTMDYSTGTVTITSGTTVTGTSTVWTSNMVGASIRFGDTSNVPDGIDGTNPYVEERIVTAVAGDTSLTIDTALSNSYTAVKYRISDPIDINESAMYTAFMRRCEHEMAVAWPMEPQQQNQTLGMYQRELKRAMECDSRVFLDKAGRRFPLRLRDMSITIDSVGA